MPSDSTFSVVLISLMQPLIFDLLGLEDNFDSKYLGILSFKIQLVTKYPVVPCFRSDKMLGIQWCHVLEGTKC
jgi:hypothetical protein